MENDVKISAWKSLISSLPGVLGVEFVLQDAAVREVHILADQSRGAKQIVRDVQSAMLARFQVELDHRIISVAQIPGTMCEAGCRLICEELALTAGRESVSVTVRLGLGERSYTGQSVCDLSAASRVRGIAQATVEALNLLVLPGSRFLLEDVQGTCMKESKAVLASLLLQQGNKMEALLGACYEGEDPNFSVVLATLDAVNRRLAMLPHAQHEDEGIL